MLRCGQKKCIIERVGSLLVWTLLLVVFWGFLIGGCNTTAGSIFEGTPQSLTRVSTKRNVPDRGALFLRLLWRCEKSQGRLVLRQEECQGTIWDGK